MIKKIVDIYSPSGNFILHFISLPHVYWPKGGRSPTYMQNLFSKDEAWSMMDLMTVWGRLKDY